MFTIHFSPFYEISVCNNRDTLAYFYVKNNKYKDKEELNELEKKDILKKVKIKL